MTIKELIIKLQSMENQDARVDILVGNEDSNIIETSQFEVFQDTSDAGYIELFVSDKHLTEEL